MLRDITLSKEMLTNRLHVDAAPDNVYVMDWGEVELEPEVEKWIDSLDADSQETVVFYIDLLAAKGALLGAPYTRQLHGKLRELRFHLEREAVRITYWIATGRRIILLTVFRKQRMRESAEVDRARRAMERCIAEGHTAEDEGCDEFTEVVD
ncbi:MAG: type II toxin-antitoxin system RelE/ParE family toxin [Actinomadura sp.]